MIARTLFLSEGTVRTYVSRLLKRLGVRDRTGAAVLAFDAGLVRPGGAARPADRGRPRAAPAAPRAGDPGRLRAAGQGASPATSTPSRWTVTRGAAAHAAVGS